MAATADNPKFEMPRFDLGQMLALQKSNLDTLVEAQKIMSDAAQGIARLQAGYVNEMMNQFQASFDQKAPREPEAYLAKAQAYAEKAVAVAREQFSLGSKAQSEVIGLFTKRAVGNLDQAKKTAA